MPRSAKKKRRATGITTTRPPVRAKLRIIGGKFRGRQIDYSGDPRTRPMKDNIREALFNLVGGWIPGRHVIDLFAGTGAVGLEALSRGAAHATLIERHFPSARMIRSNAQSLGVDKDATIITSDTFYWVRKFVANSADRPAAPWVVFCCPPYDYLVERKTDMLELIRHFVDLAPRSSLLAIESDPRFNPAELPQPEKWRVKQYSNVQICILREKSTDDLIDTSPE